MKISTNQAASILNLEDRVNVLAQGLRINPVVWHDFMRYLAKLKRHNIAMYAHSLRVGIYAEGISKIEVWQDQKLALFGGCGHDYGKCLVPNRFLNAKHYTTEKHEVVKKHAINGYVGLKDKFLFTAFIAGLHHQYQDGGYGINLESDSPISLDKNAVDYIQKTAQLVALCDFFDALTTRKNDKGLIKDLSDTEGAKRVMYEHFEPWTKRVDWLFEHRID